MTPRSTPTTTPTELKDENRPHQINSIPGEPRPYTNVRPAPNQMAYRWNAEELGDSPLRKCFAVLPLVF